VLKKDVREFVLSLLTSCQTFVSLEDISVVCRPWHLDPHLASPLPPDISWPLFELGKLAIIDLVNVGYHPDDAFIKDNCSYLAGNLSVEIFLRYTDTSGRVKRYRE